MSVDTLNQNRCVPQIPCIHRILEVVQASSRPQWVLTFQLKSCCSFVTPLTMTCNSVGALVVHHEKCSALMCQIKYLQLAPKGTPGMC